MAVCNMTLNAAHAKSSQHVDQRVGAEQVDATAQEVAHSRLRDPK